MKTIQEIAQVILTKRNSMNPLIQQGQMVNELGSDGLQEALRRRWLIPDMDSGFLQVNSQLGVVEELRSNAKMCEKCECEKCECEKRQQESDTQTPSHQLVMEHAHCGPSVFQGVIQEMMTPGTGHDSAASSPAAPPKPAAPASPTSARPESPEVGDSVIVTQEGKTYTGVVGSMKDGRYTVSFGTDKPSRPMEYRPEQVRLVSKANAAHA